jgi:hypothetical protein
MTGEELQQLDDLARAIVERLEEHLSVDLDPEGFAFTGVTAVLDTDAQACVLAALVEHVRRNRCG